MYCVPVTPAAVVQIFASSVMVFLGLCLGLSNSGLVLALKLGLGPATARLRYKTSGVGYFSILLLCIDLFVLCCKLPVVRLMQYCTTLYFTSEC